MLFRSPFVVGTQRAKDLLLGHDAGAGRIKLTGGGPGRMHWYSGVRPDWYEQMTAEVKAPHRSIRNKKVWQKKSGVRNEALDCAVYALHAARSLKINLWKDDRWTAEEARIKQANLFEAPADPPPAQETPVQTSAQPDPKPATSGFFNAPNRGGFSATRW